MAANLAPLRRPIQLKAMKRTRMVQSVIASQRVARMRAR
jgi:hypothetical protein